MKKLIALLMILCLTAALCAGCGSKGGDDEDSKSKLVKGDMFDMLEAMGNTTSGTIKADISMDYAGESVSGTIYCNVDAESKSCSFGLNVASTVKGQNISFALDELFTTR